MRVGKLRTWRATERGATMVEYGLMLMLIALVVLAAVTVIGTNLSSFFADTATKI